MPPLGWLQNNRDHIKQELPLMDDGPEMYGLHSNANISCALQETAALLDTAVSVLPDDCCPKMVVVLHDCCPSWLLSDDDCCPMILLSGWFCCPDDFFLSHCTWRPIELL
jgi:hypothetical protein